MASPDFVARAHEWVFEKNASFAQCVENANAMAQVPWDDVVCAWVDAQVNVSFRADTPDGPRFFYEMVIESIGGSATDEEPLFYQNFSIALTEQQAARPETHVDFMGECHFGGCDEDLPEVRGRKFLLEVAPCAYDATANTTPDHQPPLTSTFNGQELEFSVGPSLSWWDGNTRVPVERIVISLVPLTTYVKPSRSG